MAARGYNLEKEMKKRKTLERVYGCLKGEGFSVREMADFRRVEDADAKNEMMIFGVWHKSKKCALKEQRRYEKCRAAVKRGAEIEEIRELLGFKSEGAAYNYLVERRLLSGYRKHHKSNWWSPISEEEEERREGILERIARGKMTQADGAREIGVTKQRMPALLRQKEGRYEIWREKFELEERKRLEMQRKKRLEERAMEEIEKKLIALAVKNAESKAEKKAIRVYLGGYCRAAGARPYERVLKIFEVYYDCKERGEKMGFLKIGNIVGLNAMSVRKILASGGEKSLFFSWEEGKKR